MEKKALKADLHVHSKYSVRPSEWILQKLGCAESYTDPVSLYNKAIQRGMDIVTITDHNTLSGSLDIAHLDNTFVSEEITTYFPDDRCKVHVLAWDINEKHHEDITRYRENIFDLVKYLNKEGIVHALAHPTYSLNDKLTFERFEQLLLLFNLFEMNGTRDEYQNNALKTILGSLNRNRIEELCNKYNMEAAGAEPWKKGMMGGSDDHSSLNIARTYTEVPDAYEMQGFFDGLRAGRSVPCSVPSTPKTFGRNLYSIAYQFYNTKFNIDKYTNDELLLRFAEKILTNGKRQESVYKRLRGYIGYRRPDYLHKNRDDGFLSQLLSQARKIIGNDQVMMAVVKTGAGIDSKKDEMWFNFINSVAEQLLQRSANSLLKNISGANLFDIFSTIGSAGSLYTMLAPFFISYGIFTKDRKFCRDYLKHAGLGECTQDVNRCRMAHFTDTFNGLGGDVKTSRMQGDMAKNHWKDITMITCGPDQGVDGAVNFKPIGEVEMPEDPEIKLYYPPVLNMLDYCYEQGFTQIHSVTPGPMGLAALLISKILRVPHYSTYHTAFPQYAEKLTSDHTISDIVWKYVVWFYNQTDKVYVSSKDKVEELVLKGIKKEKIEFQIRDNEKDLFIPVTEEDFYKRDRRIVAAA
ncbi:MAG: glycosyltransferase [Deltaproteobacteria bacterium]|nr:glycosyltransferase [Deltaproteobacteria bacterium]